MDGTLLCFYLRKQILPSEELDRAEHYQLVICTATAFIWILLKSEQKKTVISP